MFVEQFIHNVFVKIDFFVWCLRHSITATKKFYQNLLKIPSAFFSMFWQNSKKNLLSFLFLKPPGWSPWRYWKISNDRTVLAVPTIDNSFYILQILLHRRKWHGVRHFGSHPLQSKQIGLKMFGPKSSPRENSALFFSKLPRSYIKARVTFKPIYSPTSPEQLSDAPNAFPSKIVPSSRINFAMMLFLSDSHVQHSKLSRARQPKRWIETLT